MPGGATVSGLAQSTAGSVDLIVVLPRAFAGFPHGGVDDVGTRRIEFDIGAASVLVFRDCLLPGLTAVGGAKESALVVGPVRVTENRGEKVIRIAWIDRERWNLLPVPQAFFS